VATVAATAESGATPDLQLTQLNGYALDPVAMSRLLAAAPPETDMPANASPVVLAVPTPAGTLAHFRIVSNELMEPGLAAQYPEIHTIRGQGVEDPAAILDADITRLGFHAQVLTPSGDYYVEPYYHLDTSVYVAYSRDQLIRRPGWTELEAPDDVASEAPPPSDNGSGPIVLPRAGTNLRTYRLACAADGEYTAFFGGTVAAGQAAIVTAINRVSGIMETELAIRLVLVNNNSSLVYTNASTDPYTNNNGSAMLGQNQTTVTNVIGSANYDIGHVVSTGGGGVAVLGCVGQNSIKAEGVTGLPSPVGDAFYVDYVIHEMGHQFGANHTFNTANDTGNRNASTAYEPGSGSTIMAYAGIEGSEDLQPHSDPYYHSASFDEIIAYVDGSIPNVGTRTADGNTEPTVNGGPDYTIPTGTPFALTASGSDANGDALTYGWEERDLGSAVLLTTADNGASPIFRSYNPTTSPTRVFPTLSAILNGTNAATGEKLPAVARSAMNFRVTVRDNKAGGGGVNTDDVKLTVVNTTAFLITSQNSATTWAAGTQQTVTWSGSAGTTASPINAATVNIRLSTDGGVTFPTLLASGVANDGSETITVPNVSTSTARIKVEPTNNIFFDINNAAITITPAPPTVSSVQANDGAAQRSEVRSIQVTFSTQVTFAGTGTVNQNAAAAFQLQHVQTSTNVGLAASVVTVSGKTQVTLTFSGADTDAVSTQGAANPVLGPSLVDGRFKLTVLAANVTANGQNLAGGGPSGNYVSPDEGVGSTGLHLWRLYGDTTGDGVNDPSDLNDFRNTFNVNNTQAGYIAALDANNDGVVDPTDLNEYRTRFNRNVF
jgi:hypothetical protein